VLGRRVLEVLAPDVAEAHEAKLLEREEHEAWDKAAITHRRLGNGRSRAVMTLPDAAMDRWLTQLHAFTSPRRENGVPPSERVPYPRKLAHAFTALLERIPEALAAPARRHHHGRSGDDRPGPAHRRPRDRPPHDRNPDHRGRGEAAGLRCRDLAGGAGREVPTVGPGPGQPVLSPAQRKALAIRDRECRAEGCDIPATWCEAHHLDPWGKNGNTDLDRGVLLCNFHHHQAHDSRYDSTRMASGLRFHRRT